MWEWKDYQREDKEKKTENQKMCMCVCVGRRAACEPDNVHVMIMLLQMTDVDYEKQNDTVCNHIWGPQKASVQSGKKQTPNHKIRTWQMSVFQPTWCSKAPLYIWWVAKYCSEKYMVRSAAIKCQEKQKKETATLNLNLVSVRIACFQRWLLQYQMWNENEFVSRHSLCGVHLSGTPWVS